MQKRKTYKVAVIGSTGEGNYGHGLAYAFEKVPNAKIVAVADDNERGRSTMAKRLSCTGYADYRKMLDAVQPDIACVCPSELPKRVGMALAAAHHGCHIYCEKPFIATLADADRIIAACKKAKTKLAIAHQWRAMPPVQEAIRQLRAGKYGKVLRLRARPKDDHRGGGEELLVHGTHWFDLFIAIAGQPRWVSGHVQVGNRDAKVSDRQKGTQSVGPIAGDSISAMFGFDKGVRGFFDSTANIALRGKKRPFDHLYGVYVECERAALQFRQPGDCYVYPAPIVLPDLKLQWEKIWVQGWHFDAEHKPRNPRKFWTQHSNNFLAKDLVQAIEKDRDPISGPANALAVTEMVQGVYASHFADGVRLKIPAKNRKHPLV